MRFARNFAILALVALVLVALPGGDTAIQVVLALLSIAFFGAIAFLAYRLSREHRLTLDALDERARLVLYAAIGLALLTFAATRRLFGLGGLGVVAWIALLALCSLGVYWVYLRAQRYR